jgi:hypothetical protein
MVSKGYVIMRSWEVPEELAEVGGSEIRDEVASAYMFMYKKLSKEDKQKFKLEFKTNLLLKIFSKANVREYNESGKNNL